MTTQLIWTIWTSLSSIPRNAIKSNPSLTHYCQCEPWLLCDNTNWCDIINGYVKLFLRSKTSMFWEDTHSCKYLFTLLQWIVVTMYFATFHFTLYIFSVKLYKTEIYSISHVWMINAVPLTKSIPYINFAHWYYYSERTFKNCHKTLILVSVSQVLESLYKWFTSSKWKSSINMAA